MQKIVWLVIVSLSLSGCNFFNQDVVYPDAFSQDTGIYLYYNQLSSSQKEDYQNVYNCLVAYGDRVAINATNVSELQVIVDAVNFDNPEIFYMANCTLNQRGDKYYFQPQYLFSQDEVNNYRQQLETVAATITKNISDETPYEQIVYLYEYVINNNEYVTNAQYNQTIISSMILHQTVCAGYASMFHYLGDYLGLEVGSMVGQSIETATTPSQYHQWNVVRYDGDYYYLDTTWGDGQDGLLYDYCMFSDEIMVKLYEPTGEYYHTVNGENTYFKKNDCYVEDYSRNQVEQIIAQSEENRCSIQFSDKSFDLAITRLITQQEIFTALQNTGHLTSDVNYITNDVTKTIYIEF